MNGSSSNTSGAQVASVDFHEKSATELLSNKVREEIARMLVVTLEDVPPGNVIFSPTAPDDHTKAWWQTDALTSVPIGQLKRWDVGQSAWVNIVSDAAAYVPPKTRHGALLAAPGASTQNFSFSSIGTTDYQVTLTPTTYDGVSAWLPAPTTFPTHFGYTIIEKTDTLCAVAFFGVPDLPDPAPAGMGILFEIDIEERT